MNSKKTLIIAEAGVNHNGKLDKAKELIDVAKDCGADIVKFQTFISDELVTKKARKAKYQEDKRSKDQTQYSMLKKLELSQNDFLELYKYSKIKKIEFLSTAFDLKSLKFLNKIGMKRFKIPSGEITNLPYLRKFSLFKKPIIISTGMSSIADIDRALKVFKNKKNISILHCNSDYPTAYEDVNLSVIPNLKKKYNLNIGYSDHSLGIEVPIAAVALGARIIEKHFTLNRNLKGPDHASSLNPDQLYQMVKAIRNIEKAIGNKNKKVTQSEKKNITIVRKSIIAKTLINKGDLFSVKNLIVKRPGNGLSPFLWDKLIGKKSNKKFLPNQIIKI